MMRMFKDGWLCFLKEDLIDLNIKKEIIFNIKPGEKIYSIGKPGKNGKPTGTSRIDIYKKHIIYVGTAIIEWNKHKSKIMLFEYIDNIYIVYFVNEEDKELYAYNIKHLYLFIYKAVFNYEFKS